MAKKRRTTRAQFEAFKRHFRAWQKRLGLFDWKVYFEHEPLDASFAEIKIHNSQHIALVTMTSRLDADDWGDFRPRTSARHEALHLLLGDLAAEGRHRFVRPDDLVRTEEAVICRLEKVLEGKA